MMEVGCSDASKFLAMTSGQNQRFALTTPLYYVNDVPHIGSAYTTMAADAIARFHRLQGHEVLLITGTDEHGQKIQRTAEQLGKDPQAHCDEIVASFEDLWQRLNIQYDRFSRTNDPRHAAIVAEFFQRVWDKGDIYQGQQKGWYCVGCEEFKEERDLLTNQHCPIHNRPVEWRDEQNYFFRLSNYQEALLEQFAKHPDFIQPVSRRNEVLRFVEQGLQDFSISRINLDWGFPFPGDDQHTLYVWFDALLGYITPLLEPNAEPTLANALGKWWPIDLHLIGKDILRFHAVYWPAMLMSADLPLPQRVFGHGFLTKEGRKMGKSLGNTLDPIALVNRYGCDAVRYYFLKALEFGQDGDFSEARFIDVVNADLANSLGNLLNRTLKMTVKYCDGQIPEIDIQNLAVDHPLARLGREAGQKVATAYQSLNFSQACNICLGLAKAGNQFIDEQAPWSLYKQGEYALVNQILYTVLESVRLSAYLLSPIIPNLSTQIYQQLGFQLDLNVHHGEDGAALYSVHSNWGGLPTNQMLGTPQPVFQKLEPLQVALP
jgi:methionyl-tRNA synthetase